jgi:hypothetical protein
MRGIFLYPACLFTLLVTTAGFGDVAAFSFLGNRRSTASRVSDTRFSRSFERHAVEVNTDATTTVSMPPPSIADLNPSSEAIITEKVRELLRAAKEVGQVGSLASEKDQALMITLAQALMTAAAGNMTDSAQPSPALLARYPLSGEHTLLYSAAPGGSSGRLFGSVVGKVTQFFESEQIFYNRVDLGPVRISLQATREVKNDKIIKVTFLETTVSLFGKTLVRTPLSGGGVWKVKFVGIIPNDPNHDKGGKGRLIRVMETPSLFVLEQRL